MKKDKSAWNARLYLQKLLLQKKKTFKKHQNKTKLGKKNRKEILRQFICTRYIGMQQVLQEIGFIGFVTHLDVCVEMIPSFRAVVTERTAKLPFLSAFQSEMPQHVVGFRVDLSTSRTFSGWNNPQYQFYTFVISH